MAKPKTLDCYPETFFFQLKEAADESLKHPDKTYLIRCVEQNVKITVKASLAKYMKAYRDYAEDYEELLDKHVREPKKYPQPKWPVDPRLVGYAKSTSLKIVPEGVLLYPKEQGLVSQVFLANMQNVQYKSMFDGSPPSEEEQAEMDRIYANLKAKGLVE